ncbi:helix-hairpin-helix domain-containing protein [Niabella sp. CC-SYL272]|uniref:helix-hairpin-helix domain-containing protein n=1 Tax=Niabella agricola TaxID=2891571 RepID=UPI001F404C63|nr:helix-hairpin-helix domain-containing protein [Niabella agricola]MCF3109351.1 helix-hairpin-helix domain-containing protein [Niabella agricola]
MKTYLRFSKKERIGLLLLILVVLLFAIQPFIETTTERKPLKPLSEADFSKIATTTEASGYPDKTDTDLLPADATAYKKRTNQSLTAMVLFNFDPNTLNEAGWLKLGLRKRTVQTIIRYRNKGGHFRKPEDLQKIYGLRADEFERIRPYITLAATSRRAGYTPPVASPAGNTFIYSRPQPIDINTADTTAYKALHGIGSRLAARIIQYREKLGGFYSISQVGETYGVPDSTFQKIKPFLVLNNTYLRKLNINSASYEALNAHPYISSKLAYLIVKQRKAAPIAVDDLPALVMLTNDVFEKLKPYIQVEAIGAPEY